ncbi:MAG: DegV family EDD domain-containing protein [Clostridiales bacterium]|jgi:DegV family protein with EDD domain|nr:DegV family EDD domain-containing protein [Clostridiales bacterium]
MGIKILADRMIDLPAEELKALDVDTIGCYIMMGNDCYSDLDDVFPEDVFAYMKATKKVAMTAAKSPDAYAEFFRPFVERGDTVLHFACSSGISSIAENAEKASHSFPGRVFVIDTLVLSNGIAMLVKYAIKLIADGETDPETIVRLVKNQIPKLQCSFLLEDLECLHRGGRCNGLSYYAANLLRIKPIIRIDERGRMVAAEKCRGHRERAFETYFKSIFTKYPNPVLDLLYIPCSTYTEEFEALVRRIVAKYYAFEKIQFNVVGCNCSVHCGRNVLSTSYMCH